MLPDLLSPEGQEVLARLEGLCARVRLGEFAEATYLSYQCVADHIVTHLAAKGTRETICGCVVGGGGVWSEEAGENDDPMFCTGCLLTLLEREQ